MNEILVYNKLPVTFQNVLCSVYGYQLARLRYGHDYVKILEFLTQTESWTKENILKYKEDKIFFMLNYVYNKSPYYKKLYNEKGLSHNDFKSLEDLKKYPVITKEMVRENWKGMLIESFPTKELIHYHTSGSTGKALDFYWTHYSLQFYWAVVWRGRGRFGITNKNESLNFTGKTVVPINQKRPPFWRINYPMHQWIINMQHIKLENIKYYVDFLNNHKFDFFTGYPSIINSLSTFISELYLQVENQPQYIFTGAEKLYLDQRNSILRAFPQAKIYEHYGFSENASAASKCKCNVYHEDFEIGHMELENSKKVLDGKYGDLITTGFVNMGMPFIRYEVGDSAIFSDSSCECGLHSQAIIDIEGRNEDYILTPEGLKIKRLDYILKNTSQIKECQFIQEALGAIHMKIVRRKGYSISTEKEFIDAFMEYVSPTMKIYIEYVDEIPRSATGKFKAIISKIK